MNHSIRTFFILSLVGTGICTFFATRPEPFIVGIVLVGFSTILSIVMYAANIVIEELKPKEQKKEGEQTA